eukprot:771120-Prorocentrum_minimum.AAC.1
MFAGPEGMFSLPCYPAWVYSLSPSAIGARCGYILSPHDASNKQTSLLLLKRERAGNLTQGEKRGRVSGVSLGYGRLDLTNKSPPDPLQTPSRPPPDPLQTLAVSGAAGPVKTN